MENVTVDQLLLAIASGPIRLVDVREPSEFASGHVEGAVLLPMGLIPVRKDELTGELPVFLICESGNRSSQAMRYLSDQGIEVANVEGGMGAWRWAGHPMVMGLA
ncbi:MAG: rhodanese-like domain-containing protein [Actinomycetes bacterium]